MEASTDRLGLVTLYWHGTVVEEAGDPGSGEMTA